MRTPWKLIQLAVNDALEEVAKAEAMAIIPEQEAEHWTMAMNCFLRCVEVCSEKRHQAKERTKQEEGRNWR
jgi:hypothetical protein